MHLPHRWKALRAYLARRKHCIAITCSPKLNTKRLLLQISSSRTWALFLPHHTDKGADLEEDVTCLRPRSRTQTPGSLAAEPVFGGLCWSRWSHFPRGIRSWDSWARSRPLPESLVLERVWEPRPAEPSTSRAEVPSGSRAMLLPEFPSC